MKLFGYRASSASSINEAILQRATYQTANLSFLNLKAAYWQQTTEEASKMIADAQMIVELAAEASGNDDIIYGVVLELHSFNLFISLPLLFGVIETAKATEDVPLLNIESALWLFLIDSLSSERGLTCEISPELKSNLGDNLIDLGLELAALTAEESLFLLGAI